LRRDPNTQAVRFYAWNEVYQAAVDSLVIQRAEQELLAMGAKRGQKLPNGRYQFLAPPVNSPANSPASSQRNSQNP